MTSHERVQMIESYGSAHARLIDALKEFPREMWPYRSPADPWSIHDIVVHIADSETNSYIRCRTLVAEPGKRVMAYDENAWAKALRYGDQSTDDALELFKYLRRASYNLIKTLPESAWSNTIDHPENGIMTMDDWLRVYERHIPDHIEQMRAIHAAWRNRR
ncbi:MAG TPA: DinB family protein [Anaerolineae bacterium]